MSKRPDYREGKVKDMAHGAAVFISELMKENRGCLPSCLNCAYGQEVQGPADPHDRRLYCTRWQGYPPPKVIVYACDNYADNEEIPF